MKPLSLPTIPSQKAKEYLPRLADALGQLKIAKEAIVEEFENARALAIASGEQEITGIKWKASITDIETSRIDMAKLEKFLTKQGRKIEDFEISATSSRLLLKPII